MIRALQTKWSALIISVVIFLVTCCHNLLFTIFSQTISFGHHHNSFYQALITKTIHTETVHIRSTADSCCTVHGITVAGMCCYTFQTRQITHLPEFIVILIGDGRVSWGTIIYTLTNTAPCNPNTMQYWTVFTAFHQSNSHTHKPFVFYISSSGIPGAIFSVRMLSLSSSL